MTGMLASVNNLSEAKQVDDLRVDIIDLKQPERGALGALDPSTIQQIVNTLGDKATISATVGDLPMQPDIILHAVTQIAATGVAYVKIGFFPEGDWQDCLEALQPLCQQHKLIAVLFADCQPNLSNLMAFKTSGFSGVMLDTANKKNGSLTNLMSYQKLAQFINEAKQFGLMTGLAGSLRQQDIPLLLQLEPDYLGFRGALCHQHNRIAQLNIKQVKRIQGEIRQHALVRGAV
jgi:(5-formylfuran-3-yl)methyl phosphate synthase